VNDSPVPDPPHDPHDVGLARITDEVRKLVGRLEPSCVWEASQPEDPLRLVLSTPLELVGVVDYRRASERAKTPQDANADVEQTAAVIDEIARDLRFAINDADTAQVLVLVVAVEPVRWRDVARHTFGPDGSRGEQVVRVVSTGPVEGQTDWPGDLLLDLQVVAPTLPVFDAPPVGDDDPPQFAGAAGDTAREIVAHRLKMDDSNERAWADAVEQKIADAFRLPEARSAFDVVARRLVDDLCRTADVPPESEAAQAGGAQ
jgi:hypothetical protein